jgi:hypothetical protein
MYPFLVEELGGMDAGEGRLPLHDQLAAGPVAHEQKDGSSIEGDATVVLTRREQPVYFGQVEVQQKYSLAKYATLHAYHGSQVSKSKCGGTMYVLSPSPAVTASFRQADLEYGERFRYHGVYLSREDLAPLAAAHRSFAERALVFLMADFTAGIPVQASDILYEITEQDKRLAELSVQAILKERPRGDEELEKSLNQATIDKLLTIPSFKARYDLKFANGHEQGVTEGRAEGHAEGVAEGRAEGVAEGRVQGVAEGRVQGRVQGVAEGVVLARVEILLDLFRMNNDEPSHEALAIINSCSDLTQATAWIRSAHLGKTAKEIFGR